ncbi:hypothetical protein D8674_020374 [Pyrus ussuriensis x Pyrus communis]|uniref:Uncharacterized protein n=1 Tax=Pyrus ussuriensis x Pyrus communis TaxID=2448454 RepID=A0A5N5HFI5_9ROSA|nr:hypothetical protein D8674_020374 [Pyrus ussuriensis x Pyrus communis]
MKAKANKINQDKKTLLDHSSLRPFLYGMEVTFMFSSGMRSQSNCIRRCWRGASPFFRSPDPSFPRHSDRVRRFARGCEVSYPDRDLGSDPWLKAEEVLTEDGAYSSARH